MKLRSTNLRRRGAAFLRAERLEARQLLAAELCSPISAEATFDLISAPALEGESVAVGGKVSQQDEIYYYADGRRLGLDLHPSRLAVGFESSDLSGLDSLYGEWTQVRDVEGNVRVYESSVMGREEMSAAAAQLSGVTTVAPVFVVEETRTEAVLLDEVVVALQPGVDAESYLRDLPGVSGYRPLLGTPDQFVVSVANAVGEATLAFANQLEGDESVRFVSPNFYQNYQFFSYFPDDPRFANLWHLHNTGQGGGLEDADQDLPEAWGVIQGGSTDIVVGVYDQGVSIDHPDLNNWVNPGEDAFDAIDNDGNGWVNDINGWNFALNNNVAHPTLAVENHGTPVAGVAAARGDNALGVTGASYGSPVMSGKISDGNTFTNDANIASGFYYFAGRTADGAGTWDSADVVNNSWSGGAPSTVLSDALVWGTTEGRGGLGLPYVFAAGNGGVSELSYPALYTTTIPGVISIGATDNEGNLSFYSQHGPNLDIVTSSNGGTLAIDTTDRMGTAGYHETEDYTGTGSSGFGGTSSASPLASGITALLLAQADAEGISLTAPVVRDLLRANTDLISGAGYDDATGKSFFFGYGALNAHSLVSNVGKAEISIIGDSQDLVSGSGTVDMGNVVLGEFVDRSFYIRNQGTSPLDLTDLQITGGAFSIQTGLGAATLDAGQATTFTVRYAPVEPGSPSATVTITSSDVDEATFTIDLSGTVTVPSVGGIVFEDGNENGAYDPGEGVIANAAVYIDANDNDMFDVDLDLLTNDTDVPIPGNSVITSEIEVVGMSGTVFDINVGLDITHTWNSDVEAHLIAPDGTRVLLVTGVGGSSDNFTDTMFDDDAAMSITNGSAPFTGSFRPMEPLSTLVAKDPNGIWTLEVRDYITEDAGTLNDWTLEISVGETAAVTNENGAFTFFDLPLGTHTFRSYHEGWTGVSPVSGEYTYEFDDPADFFTGADFGIARNDRFYAHVYEDLNGDGQIDPAEPALEGRAVFVDVNEDGIFAPPELNSFTQTIDTPIQDNTTNTSTLEVSDAPGTIVDIDVRVNATHTYTGDLRFTLEAPTGEQVILFNRHGGSGDDLADTWFDDQAATSITAGSAPFAGSFRPIEPLSAFDGLLAEGTWTLFVADLAGGDQGVVNEWEILVTTLPELGAVTDEFGNVALDLPAGSHKVMLEGVEGWSYTSPADGIYNETTSGAPMLDRTFGTVEESQVLEVESVVVNGGATQRSMVTTMDVGFSSEVDIASGAFLLENTTTSQAVTVDVTTDVIDGKTVATLTFVGGAIQDDSLSDGNYVLTIDATKITDAVTGDQLDGDGDGTAGGDYLFGTESSDEFFRLLGDANADRVVGFSDFLGFRSAFGSNSGDAEYDPAFDTNPDGMINFIDFLDFRNNFNEELPF
ncbi:S8 family serine peptidase [Planctomycetaceae bacterium SH139]